ncbi:hypothetical protein GINT2_002071 [Glugoides intestinalis]
MRFSIVLIASTLISCSVSTTENQKLHAIVNSSEEKHKNELNIFVESIDSILKNVPLEDPVVFNMFAPFLLHAEKYNGKLNGMDLRLVYESNDENLKNDWKNHANEKVKSLRCSFDIDEINDDEGLKKKIKFCKNFSNLTNVEVSYGYSTTFDKSKTWNNLMEALPKLSSITKGGTEVELLLFDSVMLKDFINSVASKSEVLQHLNKLKIIFDDNSGIHSLNNAVENFPSLVTSLPNLSEITIENQAAIYYSIFASKSGNLVKLIEKLPKDRDITINLIGRFIELNETLEFVNALKETPEKVKVCMIYNLKSFNKKNALSLKHTMKGSKLDIRILNASNGIKRPIEIPISTKILDNLLKAKDFSIWFDTKEINVEHKNVNDFLSSFSPFLEGWECERVIYTDEKLRTEIRELLDFVKAFNTSKYIRFGSNFLDFNNENAMNGIIYEVNKRDKELKFDASALLIDSENLITIYNKMQENGNFTVKSNSWLIRLRNKNMDTFKDKFEEIYKTLYPEGREEDEFLKKIEALSKLSELDVFTINLRNKDVLYIGNGKFHTVLKVLPTIKNMFEKVIVAEEAAFSTYHIEKLRDEVEIGSSCTLEPGTEEFLSNPWLRRQ